MDTLYMHEIVMGGKKPIQCTIQWEAFTQCGTYLYIVQVTLLASATALHLSV